MVKFYICETCKNIITKIVDSKVPVVCCGKPMKELVPGAVDGALEKHVPKVTIEGNTVKVQIGEVIHPMLPEHYPSVISMVRMISSLDLPAGHRSTDVMNWNLQIRLNWMGSIPRSLQRAD